MRRFYGFGLMTAGFIACSSAKPNERLGHTAPPDANGGAGGRGGGAMAGTGGSRDRDASGGVAGGDARGGVAGSDASGGVPGSDASGGLDGASDARGLYECFAQQRTNPDPGGTAAAGAACCKSLGTCTARALVPASIASSLGKSDCSATGELLCAPKDPSTIPNLPNGQLPKCTGTYGSLRLEGRCLPRCFTLGNKAAATLGVGDCPTNFGPQLGLTEAEVLCAPCYNPLDGTPTGACSQFGDVPTQPAPAPFAKCGTLGTGTAPLGYCVPAELLGHVTAGFTWLPTDSCQSGQICAPINKVVDPNQCFAKCESPLGGASACVPTYIVEGPDSPGRGLSSTLGQVTCAAGETCTPCVNPIDQSITGACKI